MDGKNIQFRKVNVVLTEDLKVFAKTIESEAADQVEALLSQPAFSNCKVRIMPDVHAGAGCVIGFTANLGDKVIPNIVGVDIGCGMLTVELGYYGLDFDALDSHIRKAIPYGRNVYEGKMPESSFQSLEDLKCYDKLRGHDRLLRSIGTLGGGNHFIEVDVDESGRYYLVIHTGSRNLGKQVAEFYQNLAYKTLCGGIDPIEAQARLIAEYKAQGRQKEISLAIANLHKEVVSSVTSIPKELCYLEGEQRDAYLHDMRICQDFAVENRKRIALSILDALDLASQVWDSFETIHNYIDHASNIVRKGAIDASKGKRLLIPINMRDGCILGVGKGNEDWNCSAPHGAGRLMSRTKARQSLSMDEYKESMEGIYTTSVSESTIDEAPMAYKPMDEILSCIEDTVEVKKILKPVYNFKANE